MDELNLRGTEFFRLHAIENPSSPQKIVDLGGRMGLTRSSRVLDVGAGTCGPAILLARSYGCALTCVERDQNAVTVARDRIERAGLTDRIRVLQQDGTDFDFDNAGPFDAAMCLGACWIFGSFERTAAQLRAAVVPGGYVALGDTYRPVGVAADAPKTLEQLVERLGNARLELIGLIDSDRSDWDTYETLRLHAMQEWLDDNPDHPLSTRVRDAVPERIAHWLDRRHHAGWAILIGRRRARNGGTGPMLRAQR